jgi:hypothetical protein
MNIKNFLRTNILKFRTSIGSYEGRCYAAAISYNTKGQFISTISQELNNSNIGKYTMEYSKKVNKLEYVKTER